MTIGERISNKRNELGYSQEDLAKKCGWSSRSSVSHLESSGDHISLKKIKKVAKALEVSTEYLMGWDESPTNNNIFNNRMDLYSQLNEDNETLDIGKIEEWLKNCNNEEFQRVQKYISYIEMVRKK